MEPIKSQLTKRISELSPIDRAAIEAYGESAFFPTVAEKEDVNIHEYYSASPTRRWEVNFGNNNDAFFLTDEEHKHFLEQVKKGAQIIQVGMLTLTNRFRFIVPVKNRR